MNGIILLNGGVAQLVRASACHAEGRGFESRRPRKIIYMPNLKQKPTLKDFQEYVEKLEIERGFSHEKIIEECLMLGEEVGELFKAIRKSEQIKTDSKSQITSIKEELADVFIFLCAIANRANIDLEKAFREKEEINKKRHWN